MECAGCGKEIEGKYPFCISCCSVISNYNLYMIVRELEKNNVILPEPISQISNDSNDGKMGNVIPFHIPGKERIH